MGWVRSRVRLSDSCYSALHYYSGEDGLDMRKALSQDFQKKSIIPLKRPVTPDQLEVIMVEIQGLGVFQYMLNHVDIADILLVCDIPHRVSSPLADVVTSNAVCDDVPHHVSSPLADVVTINSVGDAAMSGTQCPILVDNEVVTNTQPSRDDDGDIETSSDDEVVESQSTNAPQQNVLSITDPQDIQLKVDLSGWFNTSSPQSEVATSTETEYNQNTTDSVVPKIKDIIW
ncbi:hypothetical protein HAX54_047346 [Datura stramonium]|uniref:Uncharacterized protein n=1 Tax=Datura stramonium TaxID=4076 RepID=A0ABS8SST4_DATST|nr:hypothetical protein [Datura stramonium]